MKRTTVNLGLAAALVVFCALAINNSKSGVDSATEHRDQLGALSSPLDPAKGSGSEQSAEALKQTDWWTAVQKNIADQEYYASSAQPVGLAAAYENEAAGADLLDELRLSTETLQAPNRSQNLRAYYLDDGIAVVRRETENPNWVLRLKTKYIGRGEGYDPDGPAPAAPSADKERIEYDRGEFVEWFENRPEGIEHGLTLPSRPIGEGSLLVEVEVGGLVPKPTADGGGVELHLPQGGEQLRYDKLVVKDADARTLPAQLIVADGSVWIEIDDETAEYPIIVDPLLSTPAWTAEGDQDTAYFGYSVAGAGDVNGDGFADVIVGAYKYDAGQSDEGRAYGYYGSNSGLSATPDWVVEGNSNWAFLGYALSGAGDVNGDGYADVIIGVPYYTNDEWYEGAAYIYHGSPTGLSLTPSWVGESNVSYSHSGTAVGGAGDVNGDGYSDIIIGAPDYANGEADEGIAYVYLGSAGGVLSSPAWSHESNQIDGLFGFSVAGAGDINADGYADIIVGARTYSHGQAGEGVAFVYHGSASGLSATEDWLGEFNTAYASYGRSVAGAGDVNGDGYADVVISADWYSNGQGNEGISFVYHGSASGLETTPSWSGESNRSGARFGWWVAGAGDINGDGYSDILVAAPFYDIGPGNEGRVYVYHGGYSGVSASADIIIDGGQLGQELGISVAGAGDINGDGFSDVIIGSWKYDNGNSDEGKAYLHYGSAAGLTATSTWGASGGQTDANFGFSIAGAGDVNGDGYGDILVGAPGYDNGEVDEGRAYLYSGSSTGPVTSPLWMAEGDQAGAAFGYSLAGAGDVNDDGFSDLLIGAPFYDNGNSDEGAAYLYFGTAVGPSATADWNVEGEQDGANLGWSVAGAGDPNGDGLADVIIGAPGYDNPEVDEGKILLYFSTGAGLPASADWSSESDSAGAFLGHSVATAGDVNGDGYSDIIAGAYKYSNGESEEGAVAVFHGWPLGISTTPSWVTEPNQAGAWLGYSVAGAGDVNGDGYGDIVIGAYGYNGGEAGEGRALVYPGSAAGLLNTPIWSYESNQVDAHLGASVAYAGDVNGDGYPEIIVGAPDYDNGNTDEGAAFVFHGSSAGPSSTADWTAEGNSDGARFGASLSGAGDVNADGYADILVGADNLNAGLSGEGGAYMYYGNNGEAITGLFAGQRDKFDVKWIAGGGKGDPGFAINAYQLSTIGRIRAKMQFEIKHAGTPFDGNNLQETALFSDTDTGPVEYFAVTEPVPGAYHWRARMLYDPSSSYQGNVAGRWFSPNPPVSPYADVRIASFRPMLLAANTTAVDEGSAGNDVDVSITIKDPDGDPTITVKIDCNNNGIYDESGEPTLSGGDGSHLLTCTNLDASGWNGTDEKTIIIKLDDGDDGFIENNEHAITVNNVPPTVAPINGGPYTEGTVSAGIDSVGYDPYDSISYDYDCDNDLTFEITGETETYSCDFGSVNDGAYTVNVRANDDETSTVDSTVVTVNNVAPALAPGNDGPFVEGAVSVTVTPGGSDPFDTILYDYDCNNDLTYEITGEAGAYVCNFGAVNDGAYTVNIRANDDDTSTVESSVVTVNNAAPVISGVINDGPADEGGAVAVSVTASDLFDVLSYDADCNGDGDYADARDIIGDIDGIITCPLDNDGALTINVRVNDDDTNSTDTTSLTVNNVAPLVTFVTGQTPVDEGTSTTVYVNGYDPYDALVYDADCDGNLSYGDPGDVLGDADGVITCPVDDDGPYTIYVRAVDDDETSLDDSTVVSVTNVAPVISSVSIDGPAAPEGGSVNVTIAATDIAADPITYDADCDGNGSYLDAADVTGDADGVIACDVGNDGLAAIYVRVNDDDGGSSSGFTVFTIDNIPPTLSLADDGGYYEEGSDSVLITPTGYDPVDTLTYDYDCGNDGNWNATGQAGAYSCDYGPINDGIYTVAVRARDDDGYTSETTDVTIHNSPPIMQTPNTIGIAYEGSGSITIVPDAGDYFDVLSFDYDCDNDLVYEVTGEAGSYDCPYGPMNHGNLIVNVRALDDDTTSAEMVVIPVDNVAPSIDAASAFFGAPSANTAEIAVIASDPYDSLTYDFDCNGDGDYLDAEDFTGAGDTVVCDLSGNDESSVNFIVYDDVTNSAAACDAFLGYFVDCIDGSGANRGTKIEPLDSIQTALDLAAGADRPVYVAGGLCEEHVVAWSDIYCGYDPTTWTFAPAAQTTTITNSTMKAAVYVPSTGDVRIDSCTIIGPDVAQYRTHGVYARGRVTLSNSLIIGGDGPTGYSSGILAGGSNCELTAVNNAIIGGVPAAGGMSFGVRANNCDVTMVNNTLVANPSDNVSAAYLAWTNPKPSVLVNNILDAGAGAQANQPLRIYQSTISLINNLFINTITDWRDKILMGWGIGNTTDIADVNNCAGWATYCDESSGNSYATDAGYTDAGAGDYHLLYGSAATDTGTDPAGWYAGSLAGADIDGDARPQNGLWDIGWDEYTP